MISYAANPREYSYIQTSFAQKLQFMGHMFDADS